MDRSLEFHKNFGGRFLKINLKTKLGGNFYSKDIFASSLEIERSLFVSARLFFAILKLEKKNVPTR